MPSEEIIVLFPSITHLMQGEVACLENGWHYQIEPVPTNVSSECGMCIVIKEVMPHEIRDALYKQKIPHRTEKRTL